MQTSENQVSEVTEIDEFVVDKILAQVQTLHDEFHKTLKKYEKKYKELSESEKIPLRIITAEMEGLKSFLFQENLDSHLEYCLKTESYCGAEGIKKAKKWLVEKQFA